jgi:hypothetical protein
LLPLSERRNGQFVATAHRCPFNRPIEAVTLWFSQAIPPLRRLPDTEQITSRWRVAAQPAYPDNATVNRYIITIEAGSFEDVDNVELPAPPQPGEPIETHIGTCIVTSTEPMPAESGYAGKIICRLP